MKYLSKAIDFAIKNWMLIIPVFALMAIVNLIQSGAAAGLVSLITLADMDKFTTVKGLLSVIPVIFGAIVGGSILALVARFIYEPVTYGLAGKGIEMGSASLNDFGAALKENIVKFVMFFIGSLVVNLVLGIASFLVMLIMILLVSLLKGFGVVLMIIVIIGLVIFYIAFGTLISLWFPAMVIDGLDVFAAFKKSIEIVRNCFWTVFGITVLVGIAASIASFILGFLDGIPVLGTIILTAIPAIQYFVMAVFSLLVYRENTGRVSA